MKKFHLPKDLTAIYAEFWGDVQMMVTNLGMHEMRIEDDSFNLRFITPAQRDYNTAGNFIAGNSYVVAADGANGTITRITDNTAH